MRRPPTIATLCSLHSRRCRTRCRNCTITGTKKLMIGGRWGAAQHTLDMAMALYKDGATDFLQVVVAQESLLGAQQHLLQLQTQYLQAGVQLMRALGGGWSEQDLPKASGVGLYHETIAQ